MDLMFDTNLAQQYHSNSQKIRVMSETWVKNNMFCPCCGETHIQKFENNKPVADFYCDNCNENFELKSKKGKIGRKISDGAYNTAIKRIESNTNPNLFVLQYSETLEVTNFEIIPKYFFTIETIEKRKALSKNAKRAGWVGSNIIYSNIPQQGKISIIKNRTVINTNTILDKYKKLSQLKVDNLNNRTWLLDVMLCVNLIPNKEFSLSDIYEYTNYLSSKHPNNNNVQAKIRQQLQFLRNQGFINFLGNGKYKKI